jgi:hypothetical protein
MSRFLIELARPHVVQDDLEAGYRFAMAADEEHEREALECVWLPTLPMSPAQPRRGQVWRVAFDPSVGD